jgi:hypothetical protein
MKSLAPSFSCNHTVATAPSSPTMRDFKNGISGGNFDGFGSNRTIPRAMTAFTAIAWYNSIEILLLLFFVFKRYSGLYFWSLFVNAISIVPYATGVYISSQHCRLVC